MKDNVIDYWINENKKQRLKIDKLNNIIYKLEEYLYKIDEDYESDNGYRLREIKAYLKQLKKNNK